MLSFIYYKIADLRFVFWHAKEKNLVLCRAIRHSGEVQRQLLGVTWRDRTKRGSLWLLVANMLIFARVQ